MPDEQKTGIKKAKLKLKTFRLITSTLGQTYSFLNNPLAETFFKEALDALYRADMTMLKQDPDYYITASYLMHWYIEQKNQAEYEKMTK